VDGLLDKEDDSSSFYKVTSDAAAVRAYKRLLSAHKTQLHTHTSLPVGFAGQVQSHVSHFILPTPFTYDVQFPSNLQILATPVVPTKTAMTKTTDIAKTTVEVVQKGVQKQLTSSKQSSRASSGAEACSSVTITANNNNNNNEGSSTTTNTTAAASSTTPLSPELKKEPPQSSSIGQDSKPMLPSSPPPTARPKETMTTAMASIESVKKAMEETSKTITKNVSVMDRIQLPPTTTEKTHTHKTVLTQIRTGVNSDHKHK
jgi:flagellin-like hook-associated protein FlgL